MRGETDAVVAGNAFVPAAPVAFQSPNRVSSTCRISASGRSDTTKIFAWYGGSVKVGGAWRQHPQSVLVLLPEDERRALLDRDDTFVPGYVGPSGWIGVDLARADWSEIAELVEESYRATAGVRRVARLDG